MKRLTLISIVLLCLSLSLAGCTDLVNMLEDFLPTGRGVWPALWMLPQDVIDNTVLAYNWSATDPSGYSKGVPTGRYIAPANTANCIQIYSGQCAPRYHLRAQWQVARRHIPQVVASAVTVPGIDIDACRRLAESLGAEFRVREYAEVG